MEDKINLNLAEESIKYNINHLVSVNRLRVYIRIELIDKEAKVDYSDIIKYLKEESVVYGILENDIKDFCEKAEYSRELLAASGLEPVDGKDAEIIYHFNTSSEKNFKEKEDGSIDFRNLDNIANVKKDDLLCHIVAPQKGKDGIDIYGNTIPFKPGRKISLNNGKNTYITEDGLELRASTDGCAKLSHDKVYVEDAYKVENVNNETGNIVFNGSVVINGDVKAGFSVKAKGDVKVRGMVEGAYIESGSDVVISKGMNGMGKGKIIAKGDVTSKYIENSTIESEKSVFTETLINSNVTAKESIILRGQNAAIIGVTTTAGDTISAKTIGNKTNSETSLIIDISKYQEEQKLYEKIRKQQIHIENDLNSKLRELKELEEKIEYVSSSGFENDNKNVIKKHLIFKRISLNNEINELKKQLELDKPTDDITNHKIICKGIIHSNTRITIGWMKLKVRQDISYSKVYNDGNDIAIVPLNPADIE